ncbi:hypothetical protein [Massilioclostridium coli]|uniref:hypothetical protein n=1 Tax=Massilioclostridium coli TaxID=1870991 RepID=UPI00085CC37C|nr:hypothetical protein [Massilioclostridium coli]
MSENSSKKWYSSLWFTIIWLIIFPPVGIILLWVFQKQLTPLVKGILTAASAIWLIIAIAIGGSQGDTNQTDVSSSSSISSSSQVSSEVSSEPASSTPSSEPASSTSEPETTSYKAGTYKIGVDMPAGEYVITATSDFSTSYMEIASDSNGTLDSIVANDNYKNRIYVTVSDGQYFKFQGTATPAAETPAYTGAYEEGMYLVGKDIPAGEYKISPIKEGDTAYFEVDSDSLHVLDSIITNENVEGSVYQTLTDGQYIKLSGTKIEQ